MSSLRPTVLAKPIALTKASRYIPLWRRHMEYPVYQPGDPQVRLYMPNYWMKLVRPRFPLPPGVLKFEVQPQMSADEVRQMLEKLYGVRLLHAQVHPVEGAPESDHAHPSRMVFSPYTMKPQPLDLYRKVAYVFLAEEYRDFQFPDLFEKRRPSGSDEFRKLMASRDSEDDVSDGTDEHREKRSMALIAELERATRRASEAGDKDD
ncbi:hypothetical protein BOX15_Mlig028602g2 [Macrostomum lignano]|uniref:Large ribosomal subunit protein uL23m n=2 Tax=Macrostomum lignano TaxID=282301 RepID=A0A1I8I3S3_9PLAT|nr:hypothetical protein BOX15_Mlig011896g4 [Macrostomum lignano]PAA88266.1 hypothetical protein BOX15_Mlig028602g2 [Macrostomum lignano]